MVAVVFCVFSKECLQLFYMDLAKNVCSYFVFIWQGIFLVILCVLVSMQRMFQLFCVYWQGMSVVILCNL